MFLYLVNLSRFKKRILMAMVDYIVVNFSLWLAFSLRLEQMYFPTPNEQVLFVVASIAFLPVFSVLGIYHSITRFIGYKGFLIIAKAIVIFVLIWLSVAHYFLPFYIDITISNYPRSIPIYFFLSLIILISLSRVFARWFLFDTRKRKQNKHNVLIYGAGSTGMELSASLSQNSNMRILGFLDDDIKLKGHWLHNYKVLGDRLDLVRIRDKYNPLTVLLAMPTINKIQKKELLDCLEDKRVNVRELPTINDLVVGKVRLNDFQSIDFFDLLGRDSVPPVLDLLTIAITGQNVLITGAGGSIGSELCRQVIDLKPCNLILFDHSEFNLYQVEKELSVICVAKNYKVQIKLILGSVMNENKVREVISEFQINTIYHAAAYKHVPLVECNVIEGVRANFLCTYYVSKAAMDYGVKYFVFISTDKAVRPTNIMGASKRMAELVIQGLAQMVSQISIDDYLNTHFSIVRFGNVLGSSGSVIPLFEKQIEQGGPLTVTHPEVTRFFMTIPEAAQLVIQAGSLGFGGGCFCLGYGRSR